MNRREKRELDQWSHTLKKELDNLYRSTPVPTQAVPEWVRKEGKPAGSGESACKKGAFRRFRGWVPAAACLAVLAVGLYLWRLVGIPATNGTNMSGNADTTGQHESSDAAAVDIQASVAVSDYAQVRTAIMRAQKYGGSGSWEGSWDRNQYRRKEFPKSAQYEEYKYSLSRASGNKSLLITREEDESSPLQVPLEQEDICGILAWEDKLVILQDSSYRSRLSGSPYEPLSQASASVSVYSLENPLEPQLQDTFAQSGWLEGAEILDGQLYLATHWETTTKLDGNSPLSAYVPYCRRGGAQPEALEPGQLQMLTNQYVFSYAVFTSIDLTDTGAEPVTRAVLGAMNSFYMADAKLYVVNNVAPDTINEEDNSYVMLMEAGSDSPVRMQPLGRVVEEPITFSRQGERISIQANVAWENQTLAGRWSFQSDLSGWSQEWFS